MTADTIWTDDAVAKLKRLAAAGGSATEIALQIKGATRSSICGKCLRLGINLHGKHPSAKPFNWTSELDEKLTALARTSAMADAAREIGVSHDHIRRRAKKLDLRFTDGVGDNTVTVAARAKRIAARGHMIKPTPAQLETRRAEIAAENAERAIGMPLPAPGDTAVSIVDVRSGQCRFPLWPDFQTPPAERAIVCGAPTPAETCSWCDDHLMVVTAKPRGSLTDGAIRRAFGVAA